MADSFESDTVIVKVSDLKSDPPTKSSTAPVSRWELIDAIASLHVINDSSYRLRIIINKFEKPRRNRAST